MRPFLGLFATILFFTFRADAQSTYTTRYTYDADGNRTSITYPSGQIVSYTFDYADRPNAATSGATPLVSSAAYLPFGPATQIVYGNGTTKTMAYDSRYRVQQNKLTGSAGVIAQYDYLEDAAGNITQIHDATDPGFNRDFGYDDLNRLVTANSGASLWGAGTYTYDAMGNMLSTSVPPAKTFSYDGTTPKLLAVATASISHPLSYDAVGNETGYIASRSYSARNELLSVTDSTPAGHTLTYGYDGRGIRVMRAESPAAAGTGRSVFTYAPELNLLRVVRDDGPSYDVDWFAGKPIAQSSSAGLRYTFSDHLGTPILQTDSAAGVIWRLEYEPYGDVRQMRVGAATDQPLRFPGQELATTAEGSEEHYNIFRWYRSGWGRYSQPDPLSLFGSDNLYAYVGDDPLGGIDPLGLTKVYGNWCGPDWTGGFNKPWNYLTVQQRRKVLPPIDALDAACKEHDLCYGACGVNNPCSPNKRSDCFRRCDYTLTKRAYAFGGFWGDSVGLGIDRPGKRDPGPDASDCCSMRKMQ